MRFAWLAFLAFATCAELQQFAAQPQVPKPTPPRITVADVSLVAYPKAVTVAQAMCPRVASPAICYLVGSPDLNDLRFVFAVSLDLSNDNAVPLPLVEALTAFTAFPDAQGQGQNLGAICLSMCNSPETCPQGAPNACSGGHEVRTMRDFAAATAGFLINVATGAERLENLKIKTIAAHGATRVTIKLALNPDMLVTLLARLAADAIDQVKHGHTPVFAIPYKIEGTVWVDVEHFGKLAAGFGPFTGVWNIK